MTPSVESGPAQEEHTDRPVAGVGAILRGARLARDEELREVAAALRIRLPYLEAIESGAIEELPGITYGIGFVRAYSEYLGLNTSEVVDRFKVEARGMAKRTQLQFPEPLPGNRVPGGALLLIVLVLAGAVYGGWLYTSSQNMTVIEAVEAVPERLMALVSRATEEPVVESAPAPASGETTTPPASESQASDAKVPDEQAPDASSDPMPDTTADLAAAPESNPPEPGVTDADPSEPTTTVNDAEGDPASPEAPASSGETPETAPSDTAMSTDSVSDPASSPTPVPDTVPGQTGSGQTGSDVQANGTTPAPDSTNTVPTPDSSVSEGRSETAAPAQIAGDISPRAENPAPPATTPELATSEQTGANTSVPRPNPSPEPQPEPVVSAPSAPEEPPVAAESGSAGLITENLDAPAANTQSAGVAETPSSTASAPTASSPTTSTPAITPPPATSTAAAPDNRIIIQAVDESWIQVVTPTGGVVIEKLMVMGEIYRVPDRDGLVLNTGNAGALKLIVNGTLIPPIGEMGAVRRGIALSPESLLP